MQFLIVSTRKVAIGIDKGIIFEIVRSGDGFALQIYTNGVEGPGIISENPGLAVYHTTNEQLALMVLEVLLDRIHIGINKIYIDEVITMAERELEKVEESAYE